MATLVDAEFLTNFARNSLLSCPSLKISTGGVAEASSGGTALLVVGGVIAKVINTSGGVRHSDAINGTGLAPVEVLGTCNEYNDGKKTDHFAVVVGTDERNDNKKSERVAFLYLSSRACVRMRMGLDLCNHKTQ